MASDDERREAPLTHTWIWGAIDTLAERRGLSPSGLARLAGLDPTAFNRSKRFTTEGRPRWPSTESIAKVLEATATSLDAFASIEVRPSEDIGSPVEGGKTRARAAALPKASSAVGRRRAGP